MIKAAHPRSQAPLGNELVSKLRFRRRGLQLNGGALRHTGEAELRSERVPKRSLGTRVLRKSKQVRLATAALLLVVLSSATLQAEPTSIQEFLGRETQFGQLVGSTFQLEGRASTLSSNELRMKGTGMKFVFAESFNRPRSFPHVKLTGRLERDGRDFRFLVTKLDAYKPETEVIRDRLRFGDSSDANLYFGQADWAEQRGEYYEDLALRDEARRLRTLGVEAAAGKLKRDNPHAYLDLANKSAQWGLDNSLRMTLLHGATRADLELERKNRQPAYSAVLNKVRSRFPDAARPVEEIPDELRDAYEKRPQETYAKTDTDQRSVLHRLLFIETAVRMAEADLKPDGSNGTLVAAALERLVPERPELFQKYREAEFAHLESQIKRMDRARVLEFRNKLRDNDQPDRATRVVREWIDQQLSRRPNTPATTVDRAQFEFDMLGDTERALELVSNAMSVDPNVRGGRELLDLMGYGWYQGKAIKQELIPDAPRDPLAMAVEEGRIVQGMSAAQVRASLGGGAGTVVRVATQGEVTEIWYYPAQRLTLHLAATRQKPQLRVMRIEELRE